MPDTKPSPIETYRERAARFTAQRDDHARRSSLLSHGRVLAFIALILLGVLLELEMSMLRVTAVVLAGATFIAMVVLHQRTRSRERWYDALAALSEAGLDRIARRWDRLPLRTPAQPIEGHAYAADLDLYGRASVSQILGPVATPFGSAALDEWLLARAEPDVVRARQEAVRELAPMNDLRDTLALHGRAARTVRRDHIERFLAWAESPGWAHQRTWLRLLAWLLPLATWALIIVHALGVINTSLWLLPLTATFAVYVTAAARARRTFNEAFGHEPLFAYYPDMIGALTRASFGSYMLTAIARRFVQHDEPADEQLHDLQRLMHLADLRSSSMHLPVFLLTMWDIHVLLAVERWQHASGVAARDWLRALGEAEALASLATLAHDQPAWVFPELGPAAEPRLTATSLGHPLIPDDVRVHNDVHVGPPGTFLLVTGSNMSGKSTLLRAIGVNVVLAQAGAPVCAQRMRLSPLEVSTSIRVQDSLARGVSYFMAELERLKQIVDAAHRVHADGSATLIYLLDEILHGTNTAERRIAATRVIRHLVDSDAIGAATTHDLELAAEPALAAAARLVHFSETLEDIDGASTLRFDYQLRDGLATSTNALALMRIVGLPDS
jgi:Flp pilus assembly protein TadB